MSLNNYQSHSVTHPSVRPCSSQFNYLSTHDFKVFNFNSSNGVPYIVVDPPPGSSVSISWCRQLWCISVRLRPPDVSQVIIGLPSEVPGEAYFRIRCQKKYIIPTTNTSELHHLPDHAQPQSFCHMNRICSFSEKQWGLTKVPKLSMHWLKTQP